jgi:hypothetical protein
MTIERCIECENPVERTGEEALYMDGEGPLCEKCFDYSALEAEHQEVVEKLEAEVERLKAHTWEQERAAVVAMLSRMQDETPPHYLAHWIEAGEHWPEGEKT